MSKHTPSPLSGHVYLSVHDADLKTRFNREISQLREFGWVIGNTKDTTDTPSDLAGDASEIAVVTAAQFLAQEADAPRQPTIVLCEEESDAKKHNASDPDGYAILAALGGGKLEQALAASVDTDTAVDKVLVGLNWTMVQAGEFCGIARSPARGTEGARSVRPEAGFNGQGLNSLAQMLCSSDALARSVGLAAINAYWNRADATKAQTNQSISKDEPPIIQPAEYRNWGFARFDPPGDGLVVIGGFRHIAERLPNAKIIEREPKPGDVPVEEAGDTIANAQALAITGQTLMNGSLEPLLHLSKNVKRRALIGPSVPLAPVLHDFGLNEACGIVVVDREAVERFISETGTMIILDGLVQNRCISR